MIGIDLPALSIFQFEGVTESVEAQQQNDYRWKLAWDNVAEQLVSVQIDSELPSHISLLSWSWPQIITTNTHRAITMIISLGTN